MHFADDRNQTDAQAATLPVHRDGFGRPLEVNDDPILRDKRFDALPQSGKIISNWARSAYAGVKAQQIGDHGIAPEGIPGRRFCPG